MIRAKAVLIDSDGGVTEREFDYERGSNGYRHIFPFRTSTRPVEWRALDYSYTESFIQKTYQPVKIVTQKDLLSGAEETTVYMMQEI